MFYFRFDETTLAKRSEMLGYSGFGKWNNSDQICEGRCAMFEEMG